MAVKIMVFAASGASIVAVNMDGQRVLTLRADYCDTQAISASSLKD
jgi:hypothetical protein